MTSPISANPLRAYLDQHPEMTIASLADKLGESYARIRRASLPLGDPEFVIPKRDLMSKLVAETGLDPAAFYAAPAEAAPSDAAEA